MSKEEFLQELAEALAGDVPESVIRDNVSYYGSYLSQEMAKGRSVDEIVMEIGEPFILAKTIIEHCEAGGECAGDNGCGSYQESYSDAGSQTRSQGYGTGGQQNPFPNMHYIDLNKWYWKLLAIVILFFTVTMVLNIVGGIFALMIRFAGPLMMVFLVVWFFRNINR